MFNLFSFFLVINHFSKKRRKKKYLHDVGSAVEGRGHDAVEVVPHKRAVGKLHFVRDDSPAQAGPGEARVLGEGVDLWTSSTGPRPAGRANGRTRGHNRRRRKSRGFDEKQGAR